MSVRSTRIGSTGSFELPATARNLDPRTHSRRTSHYPSVADEIGATEFEHLAHPACILKLKETQLRSDGASNGRPDPRLTIAPRDTELLLRLAIGSWSRAHPWGLICAAAVRGSGSSTIGNQCLLHALLLVEGETLFFFFFFYSRGFLFTPFPLRTLRGTFLVLTRSRNPIIPRNRHVVRGLVPR